ncbi:MAG: hypothetical protein KDI32_05340 [Pseudomonadales bacterium]|nr:hypothetical protein [Pseudomonadales bacterium]
MHGKKKAWQPHVDPEPLFNPFISTTQSKDELYPDESIELEDEEDTDDSESTDQ